MREHEFEPVTGLPEELPDGEHIVWQGAPEWRALANRVFYLNPLLVYFALLLVVHSFYLLMNGTPGPEILVALAWQTVLSALALGMVIGLAHLYARSTVYTFTNRRLVLRSGIALPMMVNLPWRKVEDAGLRVFGDGTGDIVFGVQKTHKLYRMMLWPHVRPWHFSRVQPLLRGIAEPAQVAQLLAETVTGDKQSTDSRAPTATPQGAVETAEGDLQPAHAVG